jgi:DNA-binding beta-propeller fold protein YncE
VLNPARLLLSLILISSTLPASAQWTNGQNAAFVVGQPDFTAQGGDAAQNTVGQPSGIAVDLAHGKVYVADGFNYRILRFAYPITANQPIAEIVFGQSNFTDGIENSGGLSGSSLSAVWDLEVDSTGRLWVADGGNNRVLAFDSAHTIATNKPTANKVLGRPDMTSSAFGLAQNRMRQPVGLTITPAGALYVVDNINHRVLRFDAAAGKANGANADAVVGQVNFTSNANGLTQSNLSFPADAVVIGANLFVGDGNNRVLRYDNILLKANGAPADGVLGQPNFVTGGFPISQTEIASASSLVTDPSGRLYVADPNNHRIMIYNNASAKANGAAADNVIVQPNFTSSSIATTQSTGNYPAEVAVDAANGKLLVGLGGDQRVLVFSASSPLPVGLSSFSLE